MGPFPDKQAACSNRCHTSTAYRCDPRLEQCDRLLNRGTDRLFFRLQPIHAMRTGILCAFTATISFGTSAQPLQHVWANRVGGLESGEKLWRCAVDENGNVYAAGGFRGTFTDQGVSVTSVGGADILLVKYGPNGDLLWARSAGGPMNDYAFGVESDKEGNVYITGAYSGLAIFGDTLIANLDPDGVNLAFSFIARYSPDGDLRWVRTVDITMQPSNYPYCISYGIKLDRLGDLVVTGAYNCTLPSADDPELSTMSFGGSPFRTSTLNSYDQVYVQKIDTLGNTEWVYSPGGIEGLGVLYSAAFDAQNNPWLGGVMNGTLDFVVGSVTAEGNGTARQGLVFQVSPDGDPLSAFLVNASTDSNVEDLIIAGNGEVFLSGWFKGSLNGSPPASGYDGYFMRTTPDGIPIWTNRLTGIGDDFFSGIATTSVPNEVVGGAYYFYQADFAGVQLAQSAGTNSALIRMDTMGTVLEVVQPDVLSGSALIADVQSDIFGNFYLCGDVTGEVVFTNDTISCATQDMYVCKISPVTVSGIAPSAGGGAQPVLWPNPTSDRFAVYTPPGADRLEVFDLNGRMLITTSLKTARLEVNVAELPDGVYQVVVAGKDLRQCARVSVVH